MSTGVQLDRSKHQIRQFHAFISQRTLASGSREPLAKERRFGCDAFYRLLVCRCSGAKNSSLEARPSGSHTDFIHAILRGLVLADSILQPAACRACRALRCDRVGGSAAGFTERILNDSLAGSCQRTITFRASCRRGGDANVVAVRAVMLNRRPPRRFKQSSHATGGEPWRVIFADHRVRAHATIADEGE